MKFQPKKRIKIGTLRIVKRFALCPITENVESAENVHILVPGETRWLEIVYIRQQRGVCLWINLEFVTKEDYLHYINHKVS